VTIVALTGATGLVGQAVLDAGAGRGVRLRALTRRPQPERAGLDWIEGALDDADALAQLADGADALLHIAGAVNVPTREAFIAANITGTEAVLHAAQTAGVRHFVHISSLAAREPGLSTYGWSKAEAETVVRAATIPFTMVRPPAVYGPRDRDMLDLFRMAKKGFMLLPPKGRSSIIHAEDLARLLIALAGTNGSGAVLEPDDGTPGGIAHVDLARMIGVAVGRPGVIRLTAPAPLVRLAARGDRLVRGAKARLTPDRAGYMCHPDWVATPAFAPDPALWTPRWATQAGLSATAEWYRAAGWL
jgi:nucleoside-diphosphate-sugar epimerase